MKPTRPRRALALLAAATMILAATATPASGDSGGGFVTSEPAFITLADGLGDDASVTPIISSGDMIGDFLFEGLPDGIGLRPGDDDTVEVYVAHEQTTIPFRGASDFQASSISQLTISTNDASVLEAYVPLGPEEGLHRFCSAFMAGPAEGFDNYVFFTGEETSDAGIESTDTAEADRFYDDGTRQGGLAVALDTETGEVVTIPGMGRLNHENTVAIPGFEKIVMLTTDDTFSAGTSQLYMYMADDQDDILEDEGRLHALRITHDDGAKVKKKDPFNGANDYLDLAVGDVFRAEFIEVPEKVARGERKKQSPQDALENWGNKKNVFQAVRLEDIAYDPNDPLTVYIADTGASRVTPDPATGRMHRPSGAPGGANNGRIFKLVFNEDDPTKVDSFTVYADGDAVGSDVYVPFTSPDNIDTSANSLMVQEDTGNASIWQQSFDTGEWRVVATVDDASGESSGIVDASAYLGEGAWILDVQGHGNLIDTEVVSPDLTLKRESGQLLLMTIPGS